MSTKVLTAPQVRELLARGRHATLSVEESHQVLTTLAAWHKQREQRRHNSCTLHMTMGDVTMLEASLPTEVFRRSPTQNLVARIASDAREQLETRERSG